MTYKRLEYFLIHLDSVDSTNDYAVELLNAKKVPEGTVILTDQQIKGRGQRSNVWTTEAGKNLTASVIFFPNISSKQVFYLNIVVSLAIRKALEDCDIHAKIKWPNDILVNGRKICGILVENQLSGKKIKHTVAGFGVNINQDNFDTIDNATSVILESGRKIEIKKVLQLIHKYLDFYYNLLYVFNFDLLKRHYYKHLYLIREKAVFKDSDSEFNGIIEGIDETGLLLIKKEDGSRNSYDIKEIKYT